MAERRKWLRRAKAEITRRAIQERVDEIAGAWQAEDELGVHVLLEAFPEDLKFYKRLSRSQRQMWIDKAKLAACGRTEEIVVGEPLIYFVSAEGDRIKIGYSTNLNARLRSLRTSHPNGLEVLLVFPGTGDDEKQLHVQFAEFWIGGEWFGNCVAIRDYIISKRQGADEASRSALTALASDLPDGLFSDSGV